jgi:pyruvate dehydrogenase E2 component (dihydrolipoamide acetyltransferase)
MEIELKMPDLATTDTAMRVEGWLVEIGQPVKRGQALLEVETDKAVMEVEAIATGVLKAVHVQPDDEVTAGQTIATLEVESEKTAPTATSGPVVAGTAESKGGMFARNRAQAAKSTGDDETQTVPLSTNQRTVGRRMQQSKQTIPHFYLQASASAESLLARRRNTAPSPIIWDAFFANAAAKALRKFERLCLRYENDGLVPSETDAVGVAVDLDGELFVIPLTGPADKTPEQLSVEIRTAVEKLRAGDPEARGLQPANLTITNLGSTGVETFTAIVNPPEAAILAIGKVAPVAVVLDGVVIPQNRVSLTLSVDHRVVNGKYAAEFLRMIVDEIESL